MGFFSEIARHRPGTRRPKRWVWILYDQLRPRHPLLDGPPADTGLVYLETAAKPARRPYHKQKLALLISAQRHHALASARAGHPVVYHYGEEFYDVLLARVRERQGIDSLEALEPAEAEVRTAVAPLPWVRFHPNRLFATDRAFYDEVFRGKRSRLLETFYRAARRKHGLLMDGAQPVGGQWNFDRENRRSYEGTPPVPPLPRFVPDAITLEVIELVRRNYATGFGSLDGFAWPVTSADAEALADHFFARLLPHFGPFEDAMAAGEPALFHSLLSASLNLGQLDPLELCRRAEAAYRSGAAPVASAEGFVRQVLGWREFVRHVYEEHRGTYATANALDAHAPLPRWYWGEPSGLNCLDTVVGDVLERGHSHHITRLMVLSNLATLLGVEPQALNHWFWIAYVDAYEWVVTPNVVGMGTFADGGIFATKPYVSSGRYIQKMGPTLCAGCRFDPGRSEGEGACPFNHLYWDFLDRNRGRLAKNHRLALPLGQLARLDPARLREHRQRAREWRERSRG